MRAGRLPAARPRHAARARRSRSPPGDYAEGRRISQALDRRSPGRPAGRARFVDLYDASRGHDICSANPGSTAGVTDRRAGACLPPVRGGHACRRASGSSPTLGRSVTRRPFPDSYRAWLSGLVGPRARWPPDWAEALAPVDAADRRDGRIPARRDRGRADLPSARRPHLPRVQPAAVRRTGAGRRPGPLPHPGPSGRALVLGRPRRTAAAQEPGEHLPGAGRRHRLPPPDQRRPDALVRAGCDAPQPGPHGPPGPRRRTAARAGRRSPSRPSTRLPPGEAGRWRRSCGAATPRASSRCSASAVGRVGAPVPVVGLRGFFGSRPFSRVNRLLEEQGGDRSTGGCPSTGTRCAVGMPSFVDFVSSITSMTQTLALPIFDGRHRRGPGARLRAGQLVRCSECLLSTATLADLPRAPPAREGPRGLRGRGPVRGRRALRHRRRGTPGRVRRRVLRAAGAGPRPTVDGGSTSPARPRARSTGGSRPWTPTARGLEAAPAPSCSRQRRRRGQGPGRVVARRDRLAHVGLRAPPDRPRARGPDDHGLRHQHRRPRLGLGRHVLAPTDGTWDQAARGSPRCSASPRWSCCTTAGRTPRTTGTRPRAWPARPTADAHGGERPVCARRTVTAPSATSPPSRSPRAARASTSRPPGPMGRTT